ncbi:tigger transposable element-derived protein 6-like [Rhizophagus irregularis DAOM 181602=DAOM 197198]|nr:tigger transposable element-derived protein 6-like [Rhizophagus irregularis DAOM 181602=DAOM 197198]
MPPIRLQKARRIRSAISNEIKKEICEYIMANTQAVTAGLPLTDMILQQKGIELAQMLNIGENQIKFTNGWVYRFKKRNGLQRVKFSGEANSAPIETLPEERVRLRALLAKYDKEDIYNADETGLFFRMEPNQTLSTGAVAGRKMDKSRVSVLFCANATGSHKIRPLKKEKPAVDLTNIELVYLPPNTTAHLQPMDAGIIHSFKAKYKQEFCRHLIRQFDSGVDHVKNKLNIKEAIDYIAESWNNVTPTTIQNCWIKTGILPSCDDDNTDEEDLDDDELENLLINLPEETADVLEYFQLLDREIPTEEHLTEEQIIDMVRNEENQVEESEDDDENEEIPLISVKKAINGKYLRVIRVREINAKKQSTLDGFFDR